jgi:hypothetical protein
MAENGSSLFQLPVFERIAKSRNVLLAGAGGGFDVFSGLPLYFALKKQGKNVHLANWTFSDIEFGDGGPERINDKLAAVTADSRGQYYFPERYLCEWFKSKGEAVTVYCFMACGTQQLKYSYQWIVDKHNIDTIILVDGGTDSLLRGDEETLGTPVEDMTSIAAADMVNVPTKILACLGFGIDTYHGVCHAHVLKSIADHAKEDGYLGAISLTRQMEEVKQFVSASRYVFRKMPQATSIVVSSIISAIQGEFGNYHVTERTMGSELFINPLMGLYWFFDLRAIASSVLYMEDVRRARDLLEVTKAIHSYNQRPGGRRSWQTIPL